MMNYRLELSRLRRRLDALALRVGTMDADQKFVTINGACVPIGEDGELQGAVGKKIQTAGKPQNITKLLGKEHTGVKGQDAINKLLEEQNGHVKGAFERSDIGKIDLIWGNENAGLMHIIKQREKQGINAKSFLSDLSEVIEKGSLKFNEKRKSYEIWHNGKMAIVVPTFKNNKMTLLLTAYVKPKAPKK